MDVALLQQVIRQRYWLTGEELAVLLGLERPPAASVGGTRWRGHRLHVAAHTGDGRPLWQVSPGAAMTSIGVRRFAAAAAKEIPTWLPLAADVHGPSPLSPVLLRAVLGWITLLLPPWLQQFDWPADGSAAVGFAIGPAAALPPAGWAARPAGGEAALALAIALGDGAGWQCAETGTVTVLRAADVAMAAALPAAIVTTEPAPLWIAGWAVRAAASPPA